MKKIKLFFLMVTTIILCGIMWIAALVTGIAG